MTVAVSLDGQGHSLALVLQYNLEDPPNDVNVIGAKSTRVLRVSEVEFPHNNKKAQLLEFLNSVVRGMNRGSIPHIGLGRCVGHSKLTRLLR